MSRHPSIADDDGRRAAVVRGGQPSTEQDRNRWPEEEEAAPKPSRRLMRSAEDLDIVLGMLGFWTLVLFVVTVWTEVTGGPALGWALGLLAAVLLLWGLIRLRRRLPSRVMGRRNRG
ncbi:hypothetical protein [Arthrobacter sp. NPDC090010]|uniref:hypothetical protein n=1 Tax=Arthrobacter sp. NPDC090010 TaxID=3363942 RepID=UPI0038075B22